MFQAKYFGIGKKFHALVACTQEVISRGLLEVLERLLVDSEGTSEFARMTNTHNRIKIPMDNEQRYTNTAYLM